MATWEDGPEYAPHEPPAHFAAPETAPLSTAPVRPTPSAGAPVQPPREFAAPQAAPLAQIGTGPGLNSRNPSQPFAVAAATMTDGTSAWGAAHSMRNAEPAAEQWAPPQGTPAVPTGASRRDGGRDPLRPINIGNTAAPAEQNWAPPPGSARPAGTAVAPHTAASTTPYGAPPAPGVPDFRPAPGPPASGLRGAAEAVVRLLTPPLVVSLVLGLIPPIAPVMLLVSMALSLRLDPRLTAVRNGIIAGTAYLIFIALLSLLSSDWWGTTTNWGWVVNAFALVYAVAMAHLTAAKEARNHSR
ncbi:hypothetical protein [Enemella sp. A6]|uniref:hypothetical protein n=1 Tax=Enemella sp. A6 TaxID=3440152 RepID=UPI003EC0C6FC